jgi:hypothetical protein
MKEKERYLFFFPKKNYVNSVVKKNIQYMLL